MRPVRKDVLLMEDVNRHARMVAMYAYHTLAIFNHMTGNPQMHSMMDVDTG